jgi:hypothetical protein
VIGNLGGAVSGLEQLFAQLAGFYTRQAGDPTLYNAERDRRAGDVAVELADVLAEAVPASGALREVPQRGHNLASRLGNTPTPGR